MMWLFIACAIAAAYWAFFWVADNAAHRQAAADHQSTDPGRDAIATAAGPTPYPTGRHRKAAGGVL